MVGFGVVMDGFVPPIGGVGFWVVGWLVVGFGVVMDGFVPLVAG